MRNFSLLRKFELLQLFERKLWIMRTLLSFVHFMPFVAAIQLFQLYALYLDRMLLNCALNSRHIFVHSGF